MEQQLEQEEKEHYIVEEYTPHPQEREPSILHEEKTQLHLSRTQEEKDGCGTEVTEFFSQLAAVFCVKCIGTICSKVHYATCLQTLVSQQVCFSDVNNILSLKTKKIFFIQSGESCTTDHMPSSFINYQTCSLETQAVKSKRLCERIHFWLSGGAKRACRC